MRVHHHRNVVFCRLVNDHTQLALRVNLLPGIRIRQTRPLRADCLDDVHAVIDVDVDESPHGFITFDATVKFRESRIRQNSRADIRYHEHTGGEDFRTGQPASADELTQCNVLVSTGTCDANRRDARIERTFCPLNRIHMCMNVDHARHQEVAFNIDDRVVARHVVCVSFDFFDQPVPDQDRHVFGDCVVDAIEQVGVCQCIGTVRSRRGIRNCR